MSRPDDASVASAVDPVVEQMRRALGDALVSVTLYGSVARGSAVAGIADVNLLIILRQIDLQKLASLREILGVCKDCRISPYLLTSDELGKVVDAFPTRFLEMKRGYRVLHGQDTLAAIEVDQKNLEIRTTQELLNILLRFRHAMLGGAAAEDVERDMQAFLQPLLKVLRSLIYARTGQHIESRHELILAASRQFGFEAEPLLQLSNWRSGKVTFSGNEWEQAAAAFFVILQQITAKLDG